MRGEMIYAGASLWRNSTGCDDLWGVLTLQRCKNRFTKEDSQMDPKKNPVLRLVRKFYPSNF
jgi:hypothetical protein